MQKVMTGCLSDYQKIREGDILHPCNSDNGLVSLAQLYRDGYTVLFVRTVRDPVDIFESFYAVNYLHKKRLGGQHKPGMAPLLGKMTKNMMENTDEKIFEYVLNDHFHTEKQKNLYQPWPFNLIEVGYKALHTEEGQREFISRLAIAGEERQVRIGRNMKDIWGVKPVREGRMSHGMTESLLSDDLKEEIKRRCTWLK